MRRRRSLRTLLSGTLAGSLAGAAHLAAPASRFIRAPRAQTAGEATLPPGRLAYLLGGNLWVTSSSGVSLSTERRVASGTGGWIQDPCWSPDGTQVAYAHVRFPTSAPAPGTIPWPTAEIYAARADGLAEPALLVRREAANDTLISPVWSPEGRFLYVIRRRPLDATGMAVAVDLLRVDLVTGERAPVAVPGEAVELAGGDDGSLAVVTLEGGVTGVSTSRLFHLPVAPESGLGTPSEVARSDQGLEFIAFPRFAPGSRHLLFAAGGGVTAGTDFLDFLLGATAEAHGARGWPHVLDLASGTIRRAPTEGLDDLVGLAWLGHAALTLDAFGLGVIDLKSGAIGRVPGVSATGFAWYPG